MSERIGKSTMEMRRGLWWPGVVARRTTLRAVGLATSPPANQDLSEKSNKKEKIRKEDCTCGFYLPCCPRYLRH